MSFTKESRIYPADIVDETLQEDRVQIVGLIAYLQTRFYPPLPADYAAPALAALKLCNDGDSEREIILPAKLNPTPRTATPWANGQTIIEAGELIEALRLWDHVNTDNEEV